MNDFTKEELQHIYDGLWMLSKLGWEKSDLTKCKKIAGMIDNYPKEIDGFIQEPQNYTSCNHDWHGLEMDKLKKAIITHLLKGIQMERISKEYKLAVPKEQLEGFRDGLRWVLETIPLLKAKNE